MELGDIKRFFKNAFIGKSTDLLLASAVGVGAGALSEVVISTLFKTDTNNNLKHPRLKRLDGIVYQDNELLLVCDNILFQIDSFYPQHNPLMEDIIMYINDLAVCLRACESGKFRGGEFIAHTLSSTITKKISHISIHLDKGTRVDKDIRSHLQHLWDEQKQMVLDCKMCLRTQEI